MNRAPRLIQALHLGETQGVLLHNPSSMFYISGYRGEGLVVVTAKECAVITDFRYTEQAEKEAPGYQVHTIGKDRGHEKVTKEFLASMGVTSLYYEDDYLTVKGFKTLTDTLSNATFTPLGAAVMNLRQIKDDIEIAKIKEACRITSEAFSHIVDFIKEGMTEKEIALELEHYMLKNGADELAFSTIVASGENGSLPHAVPGSRRIQKGDMITMDYGAKVDGYCADMTRTVAFGEPTEKMRQVYAIVLEAQKRAQSALAPGLHCRDIDAIARDYINDNGYEGHFGHGLGHSLGIDIHESPSLSYSSEAMTKEGQLLTVEPGIYLPGIGGVRIENTCVLTKDGNVPLTTAPKELIVL